MTYRFHPEAEAELLDAVAYYERSRPGLGAAFVDDVEDAIRRILRHPLAWAVLERGVRRCLLGRFPYGLLYAPEEEGVFILAVMSLHREPGYWRARAGGAGGPEADAVRDIIEDARRISPELRKRNPGPLTFDRDELHERQDRPAGSSGER